RGLSFIMEARSLPRSGHNNETKSVYCGVGSSRRRFLRTRLRAAVAGNVHLHFAVHHQVLDAAYPRRGMLAEELAKDLVERLKIPGVGQNGGHVDDVLGAIAGLGHDVEAVAQR